MSYKLYLDDLRTPKKPSDWVIVRNYDAFVEHITKHGLPFMITFDHDLADEHYDAEYWHHSDPQYKEKTGLECAKWFVEYCRERKLKLPEWDCHSMNPVGKQRIIDCLNDYAREQAS